MIKKTLVFSNKAYLSLKLKQLVIRRENELTGEEEVITRPIEDIGIMMIERVRSLSHHHLSRS